MPGESETFTASYTLTSLDISTNGGGDGAIENTVVASSAQANTVTSTTVHSLKIQTTTTQTLHRQRPLQPAAIQKPCNDDGNKGGTVGGGGGGGGGSSSRVHLPNFPPPTGNQNRHPQPLVSTIRSKLTQQRTVVAISPH